MLSINNISYTIGKKNILTNVSASFNAGQFSVILGPNGSGKSSLLKLFSGQIKHYSGQVLYNGKNLERFTTNELATQRAVMSQQPELSFPLPVDEVILMGRYPHFEFAPRKKDVMVCNEVIELLKLESFSGRNYLTLSGGEKQRVQFARILAQIWEEPVDGKRYLFLDEPINNLDIYFQHELLQIAKALATTNTIVVAVLHDINLALQYADQLVFMKQGEIITQGSPNEIVSTDLIRTVFNVPVTIVSSLGTKPLIFYDGSKISNIE